MTLERRNFKTANNYILLNFKSNVNDNCKCEAEELEEKYRNLSGKSFMKSLFKGNLIFVVQEVK